MTREMKINEDYTITRDTSVGSYWINGRVNNLGRFTPTGYEIYRELKEGEEVPDVMSGNTIIVQMKNTNLLSWNNFRQQMKEHHNIDIPETDFPGVL